MNQKEQAEGHALLVRMFGDAQLYDCRKDADGTMSWPNAAQGESSLYETGRTIRVWSKYNVPGRML